MQQYHKIDTVFKRDPATKHKALIRGDYSQEAFSYLAYNNWGFTEKVDGMNIRVIVNHGVVSFGGKTDNAMIPPKLLDRLGERFHSQLNTLQNLFINGGCLYGEGYGSKIQKGGGNYRPDQDFVLFDVKIGECWLRRSDVVFFAAQLGLDVVPLIGRGTLPEMVNLAERGFKSTWGDFMAEGIVARPLCELQNCNGERVITKIKYKDFEQ